MTRKRAHILILILVFTMCMALSASATRVWLDAITPKESPKYLISDEDAAWRKPAEANRNLVRLYAPTAGALVTSPLTVTGEARGYWYFEASAPALLYDANGQEIARGYVTATDDWMTEDFVGFEGTLTFDVPETPSGTLVLKNDNPSGDPERDIFLHVPVRFE